MKDDGIPDLARPGSIPLSNVAKFRINKIVLFLAGRQAARGGGGGVRAGAGVVDGTSHDKCSIILYLTFAEIKSDKLLLRYFYCCLLVLSTFPSLSLFLSLHTRLLLCKCQLSCKEMGQTARQSGTTTGQA